VTTALDIIGCEVQYGSGEQLGHCWEVIAESDAGGFKVTGLAVGRRGLRERLGLRRAMAARGHKGPRRPDLDVIGWNEVDRLEPGLVVVKDGASLERVRPSD
jgi:hypothetical protein